MKTLEAAAMEYFGIPNLKPFQKQIMDHLVAPGPRRLLAVMPTGSGKTLCFSVPALILPGPTLVIYPLKALMADQYRRFKASGFRTEVLQGGQTRSQREKLFQDLKTGTIKFLLTNPEALGQPGTLEKLKAFTWEQIILDEVHCVSEWGLTFRPAYLEMKKAIDSLEHRVLAGFTATAGLRVRENIQTMVFGAEKALEIVGDPDRPNIHYHHWRVLSRKWALGRALEMFPRPMVVFCRTRDTCRRTALFLKDRQTNLPVKFFHAGLSQEEKTALQNWFYTSRDGILCATKAFGLGVDKNDIRTVIHWDPPDTAEDFLQESGRGGRDGRPCTSLVLDDESGRGSFICSYRKASGCLRKCLFSSLGWKGESCDACGPCGGLRLPFLPAYGTSWEREGTSQSWKFLTARDTVLALWGRKTHETESHGLRDSRWWGAAREESMATLLDLGRSAEKKGWLKKNNPGTISRIRGILTFFLAKSRISE